MKHHRLTIDNAAEDVPRVMAAHGKACGGVFSLLLRPLDDQHVLVHMGPDGTRVWQAEAGHPRVPQMPVQPMEAKAAVALVKAARKVDRTMGPITYRGQWKGYVTCAEDEGPVVVLERKVSSYVTVQVVGHGKKWAWKVLRKETWAEKAGQQAGEQGRLAEAMTAAYRAATQSASEACGVRDTSRRAAKDPAYAAQHPVKPARVGKDPIERLREPKPRKPRTKKATAQPVAPPADRDLPTAVPGVVYDASVGGYRPGDRAVYLKGTGQVTAVRPSTNRVKWRADVDGTERWVDPARLLREGQAAPEEPKPKKAARRKTTSAAEPADAAKDKQLLDLFRSALAEAVQ